MGRLRHQAFPGATYFVTTKCWQGVQVFQVHEVAEILISKILEYRNKGSYSLHEFVVMPNHVHLLLTPGPSTSLERAIQFIKGGSSHEIHRLRGSRSEIWQPGFHDWTIRDAADWNSKALYIRWNPVQAGLVERPEDWPYSSASGRFDLDPMPERFSESSSGAKAPNLMSSTPGLKPRPPKEQATAQSFRSQSPGRSGLPQRDPET